MPLPVNSWRISNQERYTPPSSRSRTRSTATCPIGSSSRVGNNTSASPRACRSRNFCLFARRCSPPQSRRSRSSCRAGRMRNTRPSTSPNGSSLTALTFPRGHERRGCARRLAGAAARWRRGLGPPARGATRDRVWRSSWVCSPLTSSSSSDPSVSSSPSGPADPGPPPPSRRRAGRAVPPGATIALPLLQLAHRCLPLPDEAARRLDLSLARVQELARSGEIGRKVDGRWTFTEREITRVKGERDRHALRLSVTSTRTQKRTTRRRRSSSSSGSGRLTRGDTQALGTPRRRIGYTCWSGF